MQSTVLTKTKTIILTTLSTALLVAVLIVSGSGSNTIVDAKSSSQLKAETARLEREIAAKKKVATELTTQVNTLQNRVNQLQAEIDRLDSEIELINLKITQIELELEETRKQLVHQKKILAQSLREDYKFGERTTIEIFAASESFSEFFNQQEYLNRVRDGVHEASKKVAELEEQLILQKAEQEVLKSDLDERRKVQDLQKAEQQDILNKTKGEEAAYQKLIKSLYAQHEEAEEAFNQAIANETISRDRVGGDGRGMVVKPGESVGKGQLIAYVGSTGFSTGPHLHFALNRGGKYEEPRAEQTMYNPALRFNQAWPVPGYYRLSTPFGWVGCDTYPCSGDRKFHQGLDIPAPYYTPMVAARAGVVIFSGDSGNGYGNLVVIDHGDGYKTYYGHISAIN